MDEVSLGVVSSGLYVMNWLLAARATDYFAAGLQASPVQHFWTLAVEEQFYLLSGPPPGRRVVVSPRGLGFAAGTCGSLRGCDYRVPHLQRLLHSGASWGRLLLHADPRLGARASGMLALVPASRLGRQPRWVAFALGWVGMGAIAFATYRFNDGTLFPGYAALVPTLGTAAIIAAGIGPRRPLQDRHVCLDWVLSGTSGGSPTRGTCGTGRRSSSPLPSGENCHPSRHGRPSRLLRPGCCDQSPHREALPPLEDPHPISPQSTRPWRGVHRLLGRPGFAALCGKAERSRGTGEPGRGSRGAAERTLIAEER